MLDLFDWITDFVADRDDVTADDIRLAIAREFADGPRERDAILAQYRERAEAAHKRRMELLDGEMIGRKQTMREIKESADMAETFPESEVLNWGEISFDTLLDWVTQQKTDGEQDVFSLDVESVKCCFERWWKR